VVPVVIGFAKRLPRFYFLSIGKIIRQKRTGFEWRVTFAQCRKAVTVRRETTETVPKQGIAG
jgi:hypothetical protein